MKKIIWSMFILFCLINCNIFGSNFIEFVLDDLYKAVALGDKTKTEFLISLGININTKLKFGETLLTIAVNRENKDMVEFLISKGADIDIKNIHGITPLMYAINNGNKDIVKLLLSNGANIDIEIAEESLFSAIWNKNNDIIGLLLSNGVDVNKIYGECTPLIYAAIFNAGLEQMELLISKGANVNAIDKYGKTALMYAIESFEPDDIEKIKLLIFKGANVNAIDKYGKTVLMCAIDSLNKDISIIKSYITRYFKEELNDIDIDQFILKCVQYYPKKDVIELLISNGADVNIKTEYGETALKLAQRERNKLIENILVDAGATE